MASIDAAGMAQQLAMYEIMGPQSRYETQLSGYQAQDKALTEIKSKLSALDTAMYQFTKPGASFGQSAATLSSEDYFSVTTSGSVSNVNMDLFVEQTATAHQVALGMSAESADDVFSTGGTISFEQDGETVELNVLDADTSGDGEVTYQEFANFFNEQMDGQANATLVKAGGEVKLMFSAEETGEAGQFQISASADSGLEAEFAAANDNPLRAGQDAVIWLGGEGTGMRLTNSSNTFEDVVNGVDITVKTAQESGENSVNFAVEPDKEATIEAINGFITAYNDAISALDDVTKSGGESESRGAFASDGSIRSIETKLKSMMRSSYEGVSLFEVGLSINKEGKLELDEDKFYEASKTEDLEAIFTGDNGLFPTMEDTIDVYTDYSTGTLSAKQERIDMQEQRVNDSLDKLDDKYDMYYQRYLKQYTQLNTIMMQMNSMSF
ncbi:flagellar filament capping protein FliD [Vibrio algivorus]|uniref:Flagellar hook-associated protein 2 n=1 Tax=Vibrio algivorus TaxID=1667024 RepID=A0A557NV50_9VIBR|nr:flagellar filament capping protein FliD [Vibrio algivorus]TVO32282.1 flagellar hook protein FliD [Vibrio algivorus]